VSGARIPTDSNLFALPPGLPAPKDDGGARHLLGARVPHVSLPSTGGAPVDVGAVADHLAAFFFYPATIAPPAVIPGEWSEVPGARGCTIQNVGFREAFPDLARLGCRVFGVSGQGQTDPEVGLAEQTELKRRLGLPFDLLNDSKFELARALSLPTFVATLKNPTVEFEGRLATFPLQGRALLKRLTFIADRGRVEKVFYPVYPPDQNARAVLEYVRHRAAPSTS
jgi:peroxiredoxin